MNKKIIVLMLCSALFLSGCATLSGYNQVRYDRLQLKLDGCNLPPLTTKDPALAGTLNLLPGIGNMYLGQWGLFAMNLLLWPYSILWAIPQAVIDAENINKSKTLLHYEYGFGKEEIAKCRAGQIEEVSIKLE